MRVAKLTPIPEDGEPEVLDIAEINASVFYVLARRKRNYMVYFFLLPITNIKNLIQNETIVNGVRLHEISKMTIAAIESTKLEISCQILWFNESFWLKQNSRNTALSVL